MIDSATVDKIFDAADVVDVVSDYVTLKRKGANYWGCCPFHDEKTPSFSVSPAKNIFKCFGCGKGGNAVNFVMGVENLSYYEALKYLAKKYHIEIQEKELTPEQKQQQTERDSLLSLTEWVQQHFVDNLSTQEGQAVGLSYFLQRGIREDTIKKFQLGYALDKRDEYTQEAQKAGYKLDFLEKTGLSIVNREKNYSSDRFHSRAIFPIHSISGRVIAFGGRAIKKDEVAKYQNSPESDIYHKSQVLYGLFFAKNAIIRKKKCYIVEGYCDVISMAQAGIENIVAPCGTALTVQQIQQLRRILPAADPERSEDKYVTLLYDGDAAGMHAALKNGKMLLEEGLNVKVVVLPEPEDPDSFAQNHTSEEVARYLEENEQDYIVFKINHYKAEAQKDPMKRSQLIEDIAATIEVIPDEIKRSVYTQEAARLLGTEEKVLTSRINAINQKKESEQVGPSKADTISKIQSVEVPPDIPPEAFMDLDPQTGQPIVQPHQPYPPSLAVETQKQKVERLIVYFLVRYGDVVFYEEDGTSRPVSVVEYIKEDLDIDGISLENPLYNSMLQDYYSRYVTDKMPAAHFFAMNPNPDVAGLAAMMLVDDYPLSKMYDKTVSDCKIKTKKIEQEEKDLLCEKVPHVLMDLKYRYICESLENAKIQLSSATDPDLLNQLMNQIATLTQAKLLFAKSLGERVLG